MTLSSRFRVPIPALYRPESYDRNASGEPYLVMVCGENSDSGNLWLEFRFAKPRDPSVWRDDLLGYYWARASQFSYGPDVVAAHVAYALEGK